MSFSSEGQGERDISVFSAGPHERHRGASTELLMGVLARIGVPETRGRYRACSPIYFVDHASCPAIILQGLEDRICPAAQAESMVAALRTKGVPVAYVPLAGEQHGYRRVENIQSALDAELYFYGRIFGFQLADPVEPVISENR